MPYPLGDICMIGARIERRWPILVPLLVPITLWIWPIHWETGRLIAGRPPSSGDWGPPTYIKLVLYFTADQATAVDRRLVTRGKQTYGYAPLGYNVNGSKVPPGNLMGENT